MIESRGSQHDRESPVCSTSRNYQISEGTVHSTLPFLTPESMMHMTFVLMASMGLLISELDVVDRPRETSSLADIGPAPRTVLVDAASKPFDLASLKGKVVLVSFVYTTCTGVCPATTQSIVRIQNLLKEANLWGTSVAFVSITLDPQRDTPEVLREYARLFHADLDAWHFLTGPPNQVRSIITAWGMWAKPGSSGSLDHPSRVFLLDRDGHQREIYSLEFLKPETVLDDVRGLLK